jgi:hypothetical protein
MEEQIAGTEFNSKTLRRWRVIQVAALLPLILTGVFMIYFKEASALGIVAFFLILIVGILLPQIRADLTLSHIALTKGMDERLQRFEERMTSLLDERLGETHSRKSVA